MRHLEEDHAAGFIASVSVPLPVWDRNQSLIAAAEADRRAAEAHETVLRLELEQSIHEARERMLAARDAWVISRDRAQPAVRQALDQLAAGYRRGRFTYLDYLEGQRSALDIQLASVDALTDYWRARLELERLTGAPLPSAPGEGVR
jgi:cobalt-zinc-cadmium efflux system outer membrane protein